MGNVWIGDGVNNLFSDPDNWSLLHLPTIYEDVVFDGNVSSNDCVDLGNPAEPDPGEGGGFIDENGYKSLSLINGYSGHVILDNGIYVDTLILTSGAIDQPAGSYYSEITVREEFSWTGGILNSTTNPSSINFREGSTSSISPSVGNTLSLGSSLKLLDPISGTNGSSLTFSPGTVLFRNGSGVEEGAYYSITIFATVANRFKMANVDNDGVIYLLKSGSHLIIKGTYTSELPFINDGGTIRILSFLENNVVQKS